MNKERNGLSRREVQRKALKKRTMPKKASVPLYRTGMKNGRPMDYSKMKKGIISSLD